jgi:hypothetical protein
MPGKMAVQGALVMIERDSRIIPPQEGVGG